MHFHPNQPLCSKLELQLIFCGLFYNTVSISDYVAMNGKNIKVMNWKGFE